jgi:peroxiredoxin
VRGRRARPVCAQRDTATPSRPPHVPPRSAVCTTELGEAALQQAEFDQRNVKLIGLSCNSAADHDAWAQDIKALRGAEPTFPIIADPKRDVAALLGMLVSSGARRRRVRWGRVLVWRAGGGRGVR